MNRLRSFKQRWGILGLIAIAWIVTLGVCALFGHLFTSHLNQDLKNRLQAPSFSHPFGTNNLGIDMLGLAIKGARISVLVGLAATAVGFIGGSLVGLTAAYWRGRTDRVILTFLDASAAFPSFVAAISVVLFWGKSVRNVTLVIGILTIPVIARIVRAASLPLVERDFVLAARMQGSRHSQIIVRELIPNVIRPLLGFAMITVGITISVEGGLSFIGAGVPDNIVTWGQLIASGRATVEGSPHLVLIPASLIFGTILALNTLSSKWLRGRPFPVVKESVAETTGGGNASDAAKMISSNPPTDVVLSIENLHTYFSTPFGSLRAVDGVSLQLRRGQMVALVGESGSGKTMMARSLLGLVPSPPRVAGLPGRVMFDGQDLLSLSSEELRKIRGRRIAMIFQDPMTTLNPVMRVGRQIADTATLHLGLSKKEATRRALELLIEVGVPDAQRRMRAWPHELSGGLRQRIGIAIALAAEPEILIADEPTSALDVTIQRQLLDLLDRLRRYRGLSILFITHDMGIVASRADEVAVMYSGRIVEQGSTLEVFAHPRMPYTRALLASIPRIDHESHKKLAVIGGIPPIAIGPRVGCAFAPRCPDVIDACRTEIPQLVGDTHQAACIRTAAGVP